MTIRWGLIGCGDIARKRVADALVDTTDSQLVAACRRDSKKLADFAAQYQVERTYTDAEALIQDPNIDAVYIATPVYLHLPQTLASAAAGKHVLVEKPMAMSVPECRQMVDACNQHNVKLSVAYYRRFYPIVARMKEAILSGEIGRPMSIAAATSTFLSMSPGEEGYWRVVLNEGGGGSIMDIGSHRINLFLDLFGQINDVATFCDTLAGDYEGEDTATLMFRFASGAHGSLTCLFNTKAELDDFVVVGTEGQLRASPLNGNELFVEIGGNQSTEELAPPTNLHAPLVADFVAAIKEDRPPRVSGVEGLMASEVMEKAYKASGR